MKILLIIIFSSFLILALVFLLNATTYNGSKNLNKKITKNDKE